MSRLNWNKVFCKALPVFAERSLCLKYKTSAIITKGSTPQIISIGYNGTGPKQIECCDYWKAQYEESKHECTFDEYIKTHEFRLAHREWSNTYEYHAETNALRYITPKDVTPDMILYTLYSPCDNCAKVILSYKIPTVVYVYKYPRGNNALQHLDKSGIICKQINI